MPCDSTQMRLQSAVINQVQEVHGSVRIASSRGGRFTCYTSRRGQIAQRHLRHPARPTPASKNCPAKLAQSCARKHLPRKPESLLVAAGFVYKGGRADWQWVGCLYGEVCCRRCKHAVARIIYTYRLGSISPNAKNVCVYTCPDARAWG